MHLGYSFQAVFARVYHVDGSNLLLICQKNLLCLIEGLRWKLLAQSSSVMFEDVLENDLEVKECFALAESHATIHRCFDVLEQV
jgi:hypothetical protein